MWCTETSSKLPLKFFHVHCTDIPVIKYNIAETLKLVSYIDFCHPLLPNKV